MASMPAHVECKPWAGIFDSLTWAPAHFLALEMVPFFPDKKALRPCTLTVYIYLYIYIYISMGKSRSGTIGKDTVVHCRGCWSRTCITAWIITQHWHHSICRHGDHFVMAEGFAKKKRWKQKRNHMLALT